MKTCMMGVMLATLAGMAAAQPVQWRVEDGGNGHWYELVPQPRSWLSGESMSASRGGHLATYGSALEQDFVWSFVSPQIAPNPFWIGVFQIVPSCEPGCGWRWVTSEPFGYSRWSSGEPNDSRIYGNEDVVCINGANMWNDLASHFELPYVIEWDSDCNNDGIVDKGQILSGELTDANNNGVPDGPSIALQPTDQSSAEGSSVSFSVQVAVPPSCTTTVTYRWQRRNPAIPDPAAPGAWFDLADDGTFANTDRPTMTVLRPGPAIATGYRCQIGGGCGCEPGQGGFVYTNTVNFSVACPADFNADGGIDFGDVEAFFERWENGC